MALYQLDPFKRLVAISFPHGVWEEVVPLPSVINASTVNIRVQAVYDSKVWVTGINGSSSLFELWAWNIGGSFPGDWEHQYTWPNPHPDDEPFEPTGPIGPSRTGLKIPDVGIAWTGTRCQLWDGNEVPYILCEPTRDIWLEPSLVNSGPAPIGAYENPVIDGTEAVNETGTVARFWLEYEARGEFEMWRWNAAAFGTPVYDGLFLDPSIFPGNPDTDAVAFEGHLYQGSILGSTFRSIVFDDQTPPFTDPLNMYTLSGSDFELTTVGALPDDGFFSVEVALGKIWALEVGSGLHAARVWRGTGGAFTLFDEGDTAPDLAMRSFRFDDENNCFWSIKDSTSAKRLCRFNLSG